MTDAANNHYSESVTLTVNDLDEAPVDLELVGDNGSNQLVGGDGNDIIDAFGGNDTISGGAGDDLIDAGRNDDVITGGAGNDVIDGGAYTDTAVFQGNQNDYLFTRNADGSVNVIDTQDGRDGKDTLANVERVQFADSTENINNLEFNTAPTEISVAGGAVAENAETGTVVASLSAVDGDSGDTFTYTLSNDPSGIFEVTGNQIVVKEGAEIDFETASSHDVEVQVTDSAGNSFSQSITINVQDVEESVPGETMLGTGGQDHLVGTAGDDTLIGGSGNDTLAGGDGNDIIDAFGGNDTISGGAGYDVIQGGAANDTIRVSGDMSHISNVEAIDGGDGYDTIQGGSGNDTIDLSGGPEIRNIEEIDGGYGNDHIIGTEGNDYIEGSHGNDFLEGGAGNDLVSGGSGNDTYAYDPFGDSDQFSGGCGWTDVVQLDQSSAPSGDSENPWTITVDGAEMEYDLAMGALELTPDSAGSVTFADGSELMFDGVEKITW